MTEGNPLRLMLRFSMPIIASGIMSLSYTLADSVIIGRILGVNAFAAIGATAGLHWLVFSAFLGASHGFGVIFAQLFGKKDYEGLCRSCATALYLAVASGLIVGVLGIIFSRPMLSLLGTPVILMDDAATYLSWMYGGVIIFFVMNLLNAALRALGDSKTPMYALFFTSVLNIGLSLALIMPFGISGVAAATLLSQFAACVYCLLALRRTGYFKRKWLIWDTGSAQALVKMGLPMGLRNLVSAGGGLIVQWYINGFGVVFVAGIAAALRMYNLLIVALGGFEGAVAVFTAQNFGAAKYERVKKGISTGLWLMLSSSAVIMVFALLFGPTMLRWFFDGDPALIYAVLDVGIRKVNILALSLPLLCILILYRTALESMAKPFFPTLSGFVEMGTRILLVTLFTPLIGEWGVYLSFGLGWMTAGILLAVAYRLSSRSVLI